MSFEVKQSKKSWLQSWHTTIICYGGTCWQSRDQTEQASLAVLNIDDFDKIISYFTLQTFDYINDPII